MTNIPMEVVVGLLENAGSLAAVLVLGLMMEWWVLGRTYRRDTLALKKELDFWRRLGISQMDQTGDAVGLLERMR